MASRTRTGCGDRHRGASATHCVGPHLSRGRGGVHHLLCGSHRRGDGRFCRAESGAVCVRARRSACVQHAPCRWSTTGWAACASAAPPRRLQAASGGVNHRQRAKVKAVLGATSWGDTPALCGRRAARMPGGERPRTAVASSAAGQVGVSGVPHAGQGGRPSGPPTTPPPPCCTAALLSPVVGGSCALDRWRVDSSVQAPGVAPEAGAGPEGVCPGATAKAARCQCCVATPRVRLSASARRAPPRGDIRAPATTRAVEFLTGKL